MNEMTLMGLLRSGRSWYAQNEAEVMFVEVVGNATEPEMIINPKANFEEKLAYYEKAYNEDLTMKAAPHIKIANYSFCTMDELKKYFL
jgi:hypothetical protein